MMIRMNPTLRRFAVAMFASVFLLSARRGTAEEIDGVQPAAIDQPRVNAIVRREAKGKPLVGQSILSGETSRVEAFLDTGASGVMLSAHTADLLGVKHETAAGKDVSFEDVGVGGSDHFAVSEPVYFSLAPYKPSTDADDPAKNDDAYKTTLGPVRAQVGPIGGGVMDELMQMAVGDLDVVGMPAMQGKVVVLDVGVVNSFMDTIRSYVYDPGAAEHPGAANYDPGIPKTRHHVRLSFANFRPFTKTTPATAEPPVTAANPIIGPSPTISSSPMAATDAKAGANADAPPPLVVTFGGKTSQGSWLLDTGAAASMISRKQAEALGVRYAEGTWGTDRPRLEGVAQDAQFAMTVGGVGGSRKASGFYLDTLTLATKEGEPITFKHAPVLVSDITVRDPATKKELTLDGVFGMNFLVATAKIDEGALVPDIDKLTAGGFKWVVFDQPNALLGLEPSDEVARSAGK